VLEKVDNCLKYKSATECDECEGNLHLNSSTNVCEESSFDNCQNIGEITCISCKENYMRYLNTYLFNISVMTDEQLRKIQIYNL